MACVRCQSPETTDFTAQTNIYLDKTRRVAAVAVNSPLTVCFTCGYAGMAVQDEELHILRQVRGEGRSC